MSEPRESEEQVQGGNGNEGGLDEREDGTVADPQEDNIEPQGGDNDLENEGPTSGMDNQEDTSQADIPNDDEQIEGSTQQADIAKDKEQNEDSSQQHDIPKVDEQNEDSIQQPDIPKNEQNEDSVQQADIPTEDEQNESTEQISNVANSTATVKIVLLPECQVMTMAFSIGVSIHLLKQYVSEELKVPVEVIQVSLNGGLVEDHRTLMELGVQPHGTTQLDMTSTDPGNHPLQPRNLPPQHCNTSDVITVRIDAGPEQGESQEVVVEIERPPQSKAFLGGYRHKLTGLEFHHASMQTTPKTRVPGIPVASVDTQTVEVKERGQQCPIDVATQMTTAGCYVSCAGDRLVAPGNYIPAHLYHGRRLKAVMTLQRWVRGWRARCLTTAIREERDVRLAWLVLQVERMRQEKKEQANKRHEQMNNPRSGRDLALIYSALEEWRCKETERIKATQRGAAQQAALCTLSDQVAEFMGYMARHRIAIEHGDHRRATQAFLDKCAAARSWRARHGEVIQMDTPDILRARALRDLYALVSQGHAPQEGRRHTLLTLRNTVKDHDCQLTRDVIELIDRELTLTPIMKKSKLEGLRQRINTLFFQFIKNPTFNPQAARFLKTPQKLHDKQAVMFCCICRCPLNPLDLCLALRNPARPLCPACSKERLVGPSRPYKAFLARLCEDERRLNRDAQMPYLLQENDVRHLVEMVWGGQSALSSCSDIHDLVLVCWDRLKEWSPWNCILLTKREAPTHLHLKNLHEVYEEVFISSVKYKHVLAKRYFSKIPVMAKYLRDAEAESVTLTD